ncbi:MAG: class I SAM-dependent methyltransferase [Actinomycetota bacterium]
MRFISWSRVERHVLLAREASRRADAPLASVEWGDARELPWEDDSGDTVLLLGPLYHLTERDERLQALRETYRVLHPGGLAVVAAISRFASTYDGLVSGFLDDEYFEKIVERDVREGQHRNPSRRPGWFTTAYFHLPDELAAEISGAGFEDVEVLAVEGPGWLVPDLQERLDDPERLDRLLGVIERVEREPSLLGASAHLLAIGRRP